MKPTGIVRRIDELGRVVIPKELRKTMHIREGEEMEVLVDGEESLILRKYSAVKAMSEFAYEYAETVYHTTGLVCIVTDNDAVIACEGEKNYLGAKLTDNFTKLLNNRRAVFLRGSEAVSIKGESGVFRDMAIAPIICNGDVLGGFVVASKDGYGETALRIAEVASAFLSRQCA